MIYSVYIYDGITDDRRFEFKEFKPAFSCFKRFAKAKARCAMFYHKDVTTFKRDSQNRYKKSVRKVSEMVYMTTDFPFTRDRLDATTHDQMGKPPVRERDEIGALPKVDKTMRMFDLREKEEG